jgi:NADH-quinone oxidoreductase subunit I
MDQVFELAGQERFASLLLHKAQLAKPNTYFQKIHPTQAAAIDAQRAEAQRKAEAKAKADAEAKARAAAAAPAKATVV